MTLALEYGVNRSHNGRLDRADSRESVGVYPKGKGQSVYLLCIVCGCVFFFFSSRRRHTRFDCDWSSDVCSSDLNTIYLRFCHADYHKGAALAELARLIDVPRENIFAAGDHHNDISMLNGQVAAMPACPANAIEEVKRSEEHTSELQSQSNLVCRLLLEKKKSYRATPFTQT